MEEVGSVSLVVNLLRLGLARCLEGLSGVALEWLDALFKDSVERVEIGRFVETGAKGDATGVLGVGAVTDVHVVCITCDVR